MNAALESFGVTSVTGFMLVLARVSPLFVLAPALSVSAIPRRARVIIAVALSLGIAPLALRGQSLDPNGAEFALLMVKEVIVGLAFAFAVGMLTAMLTSAGALLDSVVGYSFGAMLDPLTGNSGTVLQQAYTLIGLAVFVAIGGIELMVQGLARTYALVPIDGSPAIGTLTQAMQAAFSTIFVGTLQIAAPALVALFITDLAFGLVSRVVPQMNVFGVGIPVKVIIAMLVIAASLPFLAGWVSEEVQVTLFNALRGLG